MGYVAIGCFHPEYLPQMRDDPHFGKKLAAAIEENERTEQRTIIPAGGAIVGRVLTVGNRLVLFQGFETWAVGQEPPPDWVREPRVREWLTRPMSHLLLCGNQLSASPLV